MVEEYWALSLPLKRSEKNINRFVKVSNNTTKKYAIRDVGRGVGRADFPSRYKLCEWKNHDFFLPYPQTQYMLDTYYVLNLNFIDI